MVGSIIHLSLNTNSNSEAQIFHGDVPRDVLSHFQPSVEFIELYLLVREVVENKGWRNAQKAPNPSKISPAALKGDKNLPALNGDKKYHRIKRIFSFS